MTEPPKDAAMRAIREHEKELWEELNRLVLAAVPKGATVAEAQIAMVAAVAEDAEIKRLFDRVMALAFNGRGFLHERLEEGPSAPSFLADLDIDDYGPIDIDIEDAFSFLVDSENEQMRVSLTDAAGDQLALVSGSLNGPPEAVLQDGQRFGELAVSRDGMTTVVRIPADARTQCSIAPDGTLTGRLPNGAGWSIVYPDADPRIG